MKLFLIFGLIICSFQAISATTSYQSMVTQFDNAQPAKQQDLKGSFAGYCYTNPKTHAVYNPSSSDNSSPVGETSTTILTGKMYNNGLHVVMFSDPFVDTDIEKSPGANIPKYIRRYDEMLASNLKTLETLNPIVKSSTGDLIETISQYDNGGPKYDLKNVFRKDGGGIIGEIIGTDTRSKMADTKGVQFVCYWFQLIDANP